MKIAIITLTGGTNHGNRLQNYALQKILQNLNLQVVTLNDSDYNADIFINNIKKGIRKILRMEKTLTLREREFKKFNHKYIHFSKIRLEYLIHSRLLISRYTYFITGSDQIWNMNFKSVQNHYNYYLATFVPGNRRISYAASFGISYIPEQFKEIFFKELPKYKAVSVREEDGVKLTEQCGVKASVVLDPTLMLTGEEWNKITRKPNYLNNMHFVLTYFLGGRDEKLVSFVQNLADGLPIINLDADLIPEEKIENKDQFITSPEEFVWLISNAKFVLTDSFHAAVFSILYHKPFRVFDRLIFGKNSDMGSRIDTLLSTFHLEQCRGDINQPSGMPMEGDWEEVDKILAVEREKSLQFLKTALDIK